MAVKRTRGATVDQVDESESVDSESETPKEDLCGKRVKGILRRGVQSIILVNYNETSNFTLYKTQFVVSCKHLI